MVECGLRKKVGPELKKVGNCCSRGNIQIELRAIFNRLLPHISPVAILIICNTFFVYRILRVEGTAAVPAREGVMVI